MIKKILKIVIIKTIQLIERFEYRHLQLNQFDPSKKIINTVGINTDIQVMSDTGWVGVSDIHITQPFTEWTIETDTGKKIYAADQHIIFTDKLQQIFIDNLEIGDYIYTQDGAERVIKIIKSSNNYSMFDLTVNHPNHRFYTNGILSHNTVTSSIFIAWYICFHFDRNAMVVANKLATTTEIVDKIKTVLKNLPFFMRPGIVTNAVTTMKFDNGNRLYSQATTKTAAIGFTIHLLYADEFAHIHPNFLESFYRSIYPTLSSSTISRMIISSTPNGMNLFYNIYQGALTKSNAFNAIRVDWWEVPGRDEEWKKREIANLGNEELFNQEYGNQFLASSRLLLSSQTLQLLNKVCKPYKWVEIDDFLDFPDLGTHLKWHPDYDPTRRDAVNDQIVFVLDLGDGVGRDYSVINIFKMEPQSLVGIRGARDWNDESSFFRLRQVGIFQSNSTSVDEVAKVLEILVYSIFHHENCSVVLEINFKGNIIVEKLSKNRNYYPELFLHTKHSIANDTMKIGVKLQKDNKESYSRELRSLIQQKRIIITEKKTVDELTAFGLNSQGRYESQTGHDDIAMTCVDLVPFFSSTDFYEMVENIYDTVEPTIKNVIMRKVNEDVQNTDDLMSIYRIIKDM
jgi:hypothetical protein